MHMARMRQIRAPLLRALLLSASALALVRVVFDLLLNKSLQGYVAATND
jgi:hypothetical protein